MRAAAAARIVDVQLGSGVASPAEEAVAPGTDEAGQHEQHDAEDDLALEQLDDADDREDRGDDPEDGVTHGRLHSGMTARLIPEPSTVEPEGARGTGEPARRVIRAAGRIRSAVPTWSASDGEQVPRAGVARRV